MRVIEHLVKTLRDSAFFILAVQVTPLANRINEHHFTLVETHAARPKKGA